MLEFFRSPAVRLALAFVLATTVATTAMFGLVYLQIRAAEQRSNRLILEDEAAKSVDRTVDELKAAFEVRLTHDLRRIDYAALFERGRKVLFGNIDEMPAIPMDGKSHYVAASPVPAGRSPGAGHIRRTRAARRQRPGAGPKHAGNPSFRRIVQAPGDRHRPDAAAGAGDRRLFRAARIATPHRHSRHDRQNHEGRNAPASAGPSEERRDRQDFARRQPDA